jgi:hypothetical protein
MPTPPTFSKDINWHGHYMLSRIDVMHTYCVLLVASCRHRCRLGPEGRAVSSAAFLKRLPALKDISLLWSMPLGMCAARVHLTLSCSVVNG